MSRKHVISGVAALVAVVAVGSAAVPAVNAASAVTIRHRIDSSPACPTRARQATSRSSLTGSTSGTDDATSSARRPVLRAHRRLHDERLVTWLRQPSRSQASRSCSTLDGIDGSAQRLQHPGRRARLRRQLVAQRTARRRTPRRLTRPAPMMVGNGSANFGTLADWADGPPARPCPMPAAFSLGSQVKGDGVIDSMTYDGTTYHFG